jgi:T-complex protein 1 subunit alpha
VTAALAIANIVKSSLGPTGLDKMLVSSIGDVTITNDGATILQQLQIEHPAAKVLVELADLQDQEVGDGTTSVVIVASELLRRANELVVRQVHPTTIMAGYRIALKEAVSFIKSSLLMPIDEMNVEFLVNAAKTSMASKIIGTDAGYFSNLAVEAITSIRIEKEDKKGRLRPKYPISNIHILKAHGRSARETEMVNGYALNCTKASQGMPSYVENAKIAFLDFGLQRHKVQMGVKLVVTDTQEVERIREREMDITREKIQKILSSGANVILTTQGIDDLCLKYFVEAGAMGVRRVRKEDLHRIAKMTGGMMVSTMDDLEGNETFDPEWLGECETVSEERVGDGELIYFRNAVNQRATTVILRGANEYMLDEMDRAFHDTLCVLKRILESNTLVAGGGSVEAALSVHLKQFAEKNLTTREQLAVTEFAEALLVIPRTLSVNAALDATELVSQLISAHHRYQTSGEEKNEEEDFEGLKFSGLDLFKGIVQNNMAAGIIEPAISKIKSFRFATEATIAILRIDDLLSLNEHEQEQPPQGMM